MIRPSLVERPVLAPFRNCVVVHAADRLCRLKSVGLNDLCPFHHQGEGADRRTAGGLKRFEINRTGPVTLAVFTPSLQFCRWGPAARMVAQQPRQIV